jgi:hypothetical protein
VATIADRSVLIRGRVLGTTQAGVTIAGRPVGTTRDGSTTAFADRMELGPGLNTIEIVASDATDRSARATVQVSRVDSTPFTIAPSTTQGVAPLVVSFDTRQLGERAAARVELDVDGDGVTDVSVSEPGKPVRAQFLAAGAHVVRLHVLDEHGQTFSYRIPIVVQTADEIAAQLHSVWSGLASALAAADTSRALTFFLPESVLRYARVLEALRPELPQIATSLSSPSTVSLDTRFAELAVTRQLQGEQYVFLVDFVRDSAGLWRIAQM